MIFQKLDRFAMVYVTKMPALSPRSTVEIGKTTIIVDTSSIITVGAYGGSATIYDCFLRITTDGVVTLTNMTDNNIINAWYKGFCILA